MSKAEKRQAVRSDLQKIIDDGIHLKGLPREYRIGITLTRNKIAEYILNREKAK